MVLDPMKHTTVHKLVSMVRRGKMKFFKKDNIYRVIRITGSQDNILGVAFAEKDRSYNYLEVIEWDFPKIEKSRSRIWTSKEKVLKQVLSGLESINESLETNYELSKIYFSSFDSAMNSIYSGLIAVLIRHYQNGRVGLPNS